jgi:hypothetical protein
MAIVETKFPLTIVLCLLSPFLQTLEESEVYSGDSFGYVASRSGFSVALLDLDPQHSLDRFCGCPY